MKCKCGYDMIVNPFKVASCPNCFNVEMIRVESDQSIDYKRKYEDLYDEYQQLVKTNESLVAELSKPKDTVNDETVKYVRELLTISNKEIDRLNQELSLLTNRKIITVQDNVFNY